MNNNLASNLGNQADVKYSTAPDYRKVVPGLNFDAKCNACNKNVIVQVGMPPEEGFSLATQLLHVNCTLCKSYIPPTDVTHMWFSNCRYKLKSRSQQGEITKTDKIAEQAVKVPLENDPKAAPSSVIIKAYPRT